MGDGGEKVHYFKNLPLSIERDIYRKEYASVHPEPSKKCSRIITDLFRDKLDKAHPSTKCGMLQVCSHHWFSVCRTIRLANEKTVVAAGTTTRRAGTSMPATFEYKRSPVNPKPVATAAVSIFAR